jgi:hypothetical protein
MAEITLEQIARLLKRPIAYHPIFTKIGGSPEAGIMLSQIWYWSTNEKAAKEDGWFYKTQKDWFEETGLSRDDLDRARRLLKQKLLIEEKLKGNPAIMHYKLNFSRLTKLINSEINQTQVEEDEETISTIIKVYKSNLKSLSKNAFNRASEHNVKSVFVDYSEIFLRDKGLCYLCSKQITAGPGHQKDSLQFEHLKSLKFGGSHTPDNIKPVHAGCSKTREQSTKPQFADDQQTGNTAPESADDHQASLLMISKQDCGSPANKNADDQQTIYIKDSEITSETTTEITKEITSERDLVNNHDQVPSTAHTQKPNSCSVITREAESVKQETALVPLQQGLVFQPIKSLNNFQITNEMRQWASAICPGINVDLETERFLSCFRSGTKAFADWLERWKKWMLDEYKKLSKPEIKLHQPVLKSSVTQNAITNVFMRLRGEIGQ